jgi:hypothetical protein
MTVVHSGVFRPEHRAASEYRYLPVEVPAGCPGLTVRLEYDRAAGVLDLGCFGPAGFRGWSGGARDGFAIGPGYATPGYLPGPLEPGEWSVTVGLHRVPRDGLPYRITCELAAVEPPPAGVAAPAAPPAGPAATAGGGAGAGRGGKPVLPAPSGWRWLAGDLHAHTVHSDGSLTIDELAAHAAAVGLDFLAVTDHNTVSHHPLLPAASERSGVLLLPGQEVTTDRGHANAFGDIGWIDFRRPAAEWVTEVARRGGLLSVNHPLGGDCSWRQPLDGHPPLAEIWHFSWLERSWGGPLAWWQAWGFGTVPVGGSDFHTPEQGRPVGTPTTWLLCEGIGDTGGEGTEGYAARVAAALDALRAGRVALTTGPDATPVLLRLGDELLALRADGALLTGPDGLRVPVRGDHWSAPAGDGPYWLEDGDTRVLAIST